MSLDKRKSNNKKGKSKSTKNDYGLSDNDRRELSGKRPTSRKGRAVWDKIQKEKKENERIDICRIIEENDTEFYIHRGKPTEKNFPDNEIAQLVREKTSKKNFTADNVREWRKRFELGTKKKIHELKGRKGILAHSNFLHRDTASDARLNPPKETIKNMDLYKEIHKVKGVREVNFDEGSYLILSFTRENMEGNTRPFLLLARMNDKNEIAYIQGAWPLKYLTKAIERIVPVGYKATPDDMRYIEINLNIINETPKGVEYSYESIAEI